MSEDRVPSSSVIRWLTATRYAALFLALLGLDPLYFVLTRNVTWESRLTFLAVWIGVALLPLFPRVGGGMTLLGVLVALGHRGLRVRPETVLGGLVGLAGLLLGWKEARSRGAQPAIDAGRAASRTWRPPQFGLTRLLAVVVVVSAASCVAGWLERAQRGTRLESYMMRRLAAIAAVCPPGLTPAQWANCVGCTTTMIGNASLNSADPEELSELTRRFDERIGATADLDFLDWLWDEVPPASRRSMVNWHHRPSLYRGAGLLLDRTQLAALPPHTRRVFLRDPSPAALAQLSRLPGLERVWVDPMYADDEEVAGDQSLLHFQDLVQLKRLELRGLELTGAGFASWGRLTALEILDLTESRVDDSGFRCLPALPNLRVLILHETAVSTVGEDLTVRFPRLRILGLQQTRVTQEERDRLIASHPDLIVW